MVGEIVGEELANNTNISDKWVSATSQISTLFSASAVGLDAKTAQQTAKNAVENNALRIRKEIKNRKLLEKLKDVHGEIIAKYNEKYEAEIKAGTKTRLTAKNFWIDVTGGDRYSKQIDGITVWFSRDTGNIIKDAGEKTSHGEKHGARAVDIQFGLIDAQKGDHSLKNIILDVLKNDVDIGGTNREFIKIFGKNSNVIDEKDHIHFNISKYNINPKINHNYDPKDKPNPRDFEILPNLDIFPSNNPKGAHIPSWYCVNVGIGCVK